MGLPNRRLETLHRAINPMDDIRSLVALAKLMHAYRPHVIHTHLSKAGLVGRAAALAASPAVRVHTFHGNVFGGTSRRACHRRSSRSNAGSVAPPPIVALSAPPALGAAGAGHRTPRPDRIVPLGLDLARSASPDRAAARERLGLAQDELVVLAIGRLVPISAPGSAHRGGRYRRAAHPRPAARNRRRRRGADGARVASRDETSLERIVTFAGWSSDSPAWYAAADVVTLTSIAKGRRSR